MVDCSSHFLSALRCENRKRPPVWLMRQAGRYLPEYRKLREKWSLRELFFTPELAAQVTQMPIDRIGVDAAILFSDITVVALPLGFKLDFQEGPLIEPLWTPSHTLEIREVREVLEPIAQAIRYVKQDSFPLIGFCGGPFTVASYLIEKHKGEGLTQTKKWMFQEPKAWVHLLDQICQVSIDYLKMQVEAGVDAIQIFDSWAHVLSEPDWKRFAAPYLKRMIDAVEVPVILFMRGSSLFADELVQLAPRAISFDWQKPMKELRKKVPGHIAVQGNLDPDLLYAPHPEIRTQTKKLLSDMGPDPGFIVNLGHGVKPDVSVDAVRCLIESVKS